MRLEGLVLALLLAAGAAQAQPAGSDSDADWKESEVPPPPALRTTGLVALEVPGSSLHFGVDPGSVAVGSDKVVRYVAVATGVGGAVNGMYEGLRCSTGEVKVYARYLPGSGWTEVRDGQWRSIRESQFRHSRAIARDGACIGHGTNRSAAQIVRELSSPVEHRFELTK
jgi:hypothetical protein